MAKIKVGIRIPAFPDSIVLKANAPMLVDQIIDYLQPFETDFESIWLCDHLYPWIGNLDPSTDAFENWTTLSYLAGVFKHYAVGAIVSCNLFRHPALVAKMAATLHTWSKGRFILGIGAGWMEREYLAYGYGANFPSPLERVKRFEEAIQIIRKMWTGDPVSFHGQYYRVENVICTPNMRAPPPLMIGTGGEKVMMRLVARYADWWNYSGSPDIAHKLHVLNQHCSAVERNPDTLLKTCTTFLALAETEDKAKEIAARTVYPTWVKTGWSNLILATPEQIVDHFQNYIELGIEYFILRFLDFPKLDGTNLFLDAVVPYIK